MSLSKFFKNPLRAVASTFLPDDLQHMLIPDKTLEFIDDPSKTLESTFKPEFGAPEMRQSQQMLADALRANPVPTTDEARRSEDYMRQARRRRGRAASVLAGRSETSTPLGSTGAPPSYGARSVLG